MYPQKYQISKLEMAVVVSSMLIGVGILTMPRALAVEVGTGDGWISIILSAVFNMVLVFIIIRLHRNFPEKTVTQFLQQQFFGKWLSKVFNLAFILFFCVMLGYQARMLTVVVQMYLLVFTPVYITAIMIFLICTYAVTKGTQGIVHLNLMFFPIVLVLLFSLILYNVANANFDALLPIAPEGIVPILRGTKETITAFLGIEIMFFLLANVKAEDLQAKPINVGIFLIALLYLATTILCYTVLGVDATKVITFPLVALAKEVEIIEGLIERLEPLMIAIWIMTIFNTMILFLFLATKIIKEEFAKKMRFSNVAIWFVFLVYFITFIPDSIDELFLMGKYISYYGVGLVFVTLVTCYFFVFKNKHSQKQGRNEVV